MLKGSGMFGLERQVRFLVEQYYDVQKLRVEAFNRIVAFAGSQVESESRNVDASHFERETHEHGASHYMLETHVRNASHQSNEPHDKIASHTVSETQMRDASHEEIETQVENASQYKTETHIASAVKPSALASKIISLKVEVPKEIAEIVWYHNSLLETEKQLAKRLDAWSSHNPIRIVYLSKIVGIGKILSSGIIAWLTPISRFSNISKLWSYCGLNPSQKRRKGEKLGYNPRLKTLLWKVASSFEKQNAKKSQYRKLYETQKAYYLNRPDLKVKVDAEEKGIKGHIRNMTLRYVEKRFLADLWLTWRKLENLPTTEPYAISILNHTGFETPKVDMEERA